MKTAIKDFIIFSSGAAIGAYAAYKYLSKRYFLTEYREIDEDTPGKPDEPIIVEPEKETEREYEEAMNKYKPVDDAENIEQPCMPEPVADSPYSISEAEFGDRDYDEISLTYFEDGVFADDYDEEIEDVEGMIGYGAADIFENDDTITVIYVRNERLKCDYEITRDGGTYEELTERRPYLKRKDE